MRLFLVMFIVMFAFGNTFAQSSINDYKYIIIPKQYNFLDEEDKFQLNSLTHFLFNKYGYTALKEGETLPNDVFRNRCLGLNVVVNKVKGGFLKTKLQIELHNCKGITVIKSKEGSTKEKNYSKAYKLALRDAFTTFQMLEYNYVPNPSVIQMGGGSSVEAGNAPNNSPHQETVLTSSKDSATNSKTKKTDLSLLTEDTILTAKASGYGFLVVNSDNTSIMELYRIGVANTYLVKDLNAIVHTVDNQWLLSRNDGKSLTVTPINITFKE